jgi:hypothetical protein
VTSFKQNRLFVGLYFANLSDASDECSLEASIKKFDNNGKFITSWRILRAGDSEADPEHFSKI